MDNTLPRVISRTQIKLNDAKKKRLELLKLQQLNEKVIKTQQIFSEIESIIKDDPEFLKNLEDFVNDIKQDMVDSTVESLVVTTLEKNEEIFSDVSESEDRLETPISVEDTGGPINDEECDENVSIHDNNVFSSDGPTSNQQLIDILREKGFYVKACKGKIRPYHSIKKRGCRKKLCIENHITKNINEYIITTIGETDYSSQVNDWNKFCNRANSGRRKYEFKGKNIVEVISMVDIILS
uniref:Uncharacterized protein n=1 Tax=viral metagenome TaxID=1070528 RepID=A0A6C0C5B7_9ZZZZ